MKKATNPDTQHSVIVIYADDKKGLLGQILVFFNRRDYPILSLNVSRTDIAEIVLITVEVVVPAAELPLLLRKVEKIIEVYQAKSYTPHEAELDKVGFFRLSREIINPAFWSVIQKYGAVVSRMNDDSLVIRKTGSDADLYSFYEQIDGPHLIGFCKSCLIAEEKLSTVNLY